MSERKILVTGGATGLGASVTDLLGARGENVAVLDVVGPGIGPRAAVHQLVDLSDSRAAERAVAAAAHELAGLDAVVTCGGIDACGRLADIEAAQWERVIAVNLVGMAAVVRAGLPWLAHPDGRVVTVASTRTLRGLPAATAYWASTFGVVGFSRALAAETAGAPAVTCVLPGALAAECLNGDPDELGPAEWELDDPTDVAQAVVFALDQPAGCAIRELVVSPTAEPSAT